MPKISLPFFNVNIEPQSFSVIGPIRGLRNYPIIVMANELHILLARADCRMSAVGDDGHRYKVVRFLLKLNGELVFSAEGCPQKHIPAHYQMAHNNPKRAKCITAGNAFFDNNQRLSAINHKSGDFRPTFDSLQFALHALLQQKIPMKQEIMIIKLNPAGAVLHTYTVKIKDIDINMPVDIDSQNVLKDEDNSNEVNVIKQRIVKQIARLEMGAHSYNPYWINSSKKLKAIVCALDKLPCEADVEYLAAAIKDPNSEIYKALNIHRLSPLTLFGRFGWHYSKSLQNIHESMPHRFRPFLI